MRYSFKGKNVSVGDDVRDWTEKKLGRLARLLPEDTDVSVTLSKTRHQYKMEVSIPLHKRQVRAEVEDTEVASCLDSAADILEKQIVKYKGRLRERSRRNAATAEEVRYLSEQPEPMDAPSLVIQRTKRFALKPMDAQDAVMEMELLGHSFFVFRSAATDEVHVVYKRNDGEYGLIEPE